MFQSTSRWKELLTVALAFALGACATAAPARTGPASSSPDVNRPRAPHDSSQGHFINATRWFVRVYVDVDPGRIADAPPLVLKPGESRAWQLAIGQHRVIARAFATGAGDAVMGRFDRTIELDPQRGGWFLRFQEADFR